MSTSIDRTYQLFTVKDLASLFQVSRSTIFRLRSAQGWPHIMLGAEIRFSLDDIAAIQKMNRKDVDPAQPRKRPNVGTRAKRAQAKGSVRTESAKRSK
ncbi:helix-turn-helix domain-containing protein [Paenarthrobacter ilicis]|uniref:helix-turn-helix domain-containing protein n=1 Tax=Paenarthrobacter ilicis TaxID=43665 RepID=UPI00386CDDE0